MESNVNAAATPPWGLSRSRIMTCSETPTPTTTRQLALRRFGLNIDGTSLTAVGSGALNSNLIAGGCTAVVMPRSCLMTSSQTASHLASSTDAFGQNALL